MMETQRLEARIGAEQKAMISRAAQMLGSSLTDFVVTSAYERAVDTIARHQKLTLSDEQSACFAEVLLADNEPGARLKKAARRYRKSPLA